VVVAAFVWDLRGRSDVPFPFAGRTVGVGEAIGEDAIEWHAVPRGLMSQPDLTAAVAARDIEEGEPITTAAIGSGPIIPEGWWSVPVVLPAAAVPGRAVRLVLTAPPRDVDGIVVAAGRDDLLGGSGTGLVAVPAEAARPVAIAALDGMLVVLVEP
jgi:hypothetical protein